MSVKARSGKTTPTTNLPPWRQIRWALVFLFVALTAVPLIAVQAINIIEGSQNARQMVFSQLESVAELKIDQIDRWIAANDIALDIIGAALNDPLVALAESPDEDASQALQQRMAELIVPDEEGETPLLTELFFYTTDGVIRAASSESQVGKIVTQQPYYAPSLSEETLTDPYIQPPFYDVATGDLTMIFTYPITNEAGELVGVLAAKPEVGFLGEVMTQRTGLGETGETYLVSLESHYLLTPSHFEGYPLRRAYHSEGIDRALEGESGSGLYEGYRGTRVFGVYRWLPELQAALIAEEEQAEAFAPFREVTATTASLTGLAVLVAAALGSIAAIELSRPINALTEAAVRIAGGDFSKRAKVRARNEIGVLADTFNMMAERIQDLVTTLEERVAARTRDLEVAVEVSRQVSTILDLDRLLTEFVELTKESFNLYHVHVYLLDETGRTLAVQAGSGEAGRILKQRGHHIPLNTEHSLVARAARLLEPVVINDVTQEPDFLPNPLLPKTRSEMAIPLAVGDQLVGVLDVQADEPNHFEKEDVQALMVLAGQVAVAVQNASTFTERERVQAERERIRRRQELAYELGRQLTTLLDPEALLRETVNRLSEAFEYYHAHVYLLDEEEQKLVVAEGLGEAGRIMKESGHSIALDVERSLVARAARSRQPIVVNDVTGDPDHLPNPLLPETRAEVAVPLIFGERVLGVLDVQSRLTGHFDEDEVRTLQIIANQLAVALSNARLFRETESALLQVEGLYQAGQALIAAQDMEEMLRAFAMPLWSKGKCDATLFQVGPDGSKSPEWVEVVAYASETGTPPAPVGQRFPVPNLSPFSKLAENPDHILLIPDVMESEHLDEEMARRFLRINIRSLVLVPLVVADEWEGVVAFSWPEPHTLSEEDVQLYNALTPQMATLVHNQHLFREVEQSERLLRSIIDSTQDWIFVKDRDFRYVLVNRAFAEFYGQRSPEEMIGKDDYDLGTPAYLIEGDPERGIRGFRTDDRAVIEEGKTIHNPFDVVLWPDGSE
ncbi:MAG TPA: GAF domain-containing protein, partial [Chloroflexi bacterium]|nr:GAF domain-containing protein [Chloroflexota bacterium]